MRGGHLRVKITPSTSQLAETDSVLIVQNRWTRMSGELALMGEMALGEVLQKNPKKRPRGKRVGGIQLIRGTRGGKNL